jgi:hypothetical protein
MYNIDNIDLGNTPFTRQGVRPLLVNQDGGLYLGLKPAGAALPFAQMFGGNGPMGIMRISIWDGGAELPFTVNSGAFVTELKSAAGTVRFTTDRDANAMRVEGDVPQMRLSSEMAHGVNSAVLPDGAETGLGGRIVYKVVRGDFTFDDTWVLANWSNVAPCLDVRPSGGKLELVCFELPADREPPALTKTFDECAAENAADFSAFKKALIPTDDLSAYSLWSTPPKTDSVGLAEESYLFAAPRPAFERVLASAVAGKKSVTPKFAAAALRLAGCRMLDAIPGEDVKRLRGVLEESLDWWKKYRYDGSKGRYFFAYRGETGETNPVWFGKAPVYHPELQERVSELVEAVSRLS